jgi:hypothetical protein
MSNDMPPDLAGRLFVVDHRGLMTVTLVEDWQAAVAIHRSSAAMMLVLADDAEQARRYAVDWFYSRSKPRSSFKRSWHNGKLINYLVSDGSWNDNTRSINK